MKKLLLLLTGLLLSISSIKAQNPGELDLTFNPDGLNFGDGANSTVRSMINLPDGKILIGGLFTSYNGTNINRIARINANGSLDTSFNPGIGANNLVQSMVLQPDGKILIGGDFTSYNGTTRNYIARINADGSLDTTFNPGTGANSTVRSIVLQPDGKILIGGDFPGYNGTTRNYIARINADGSLDTTFNPGTGANSTVRSIVLQPDGKILIGGDFTRYNGTTRNYIARINVDGSLDTSFNPGTGASSTVQSMVPQPDGKILIGGQFNSYNGTGRNYIARINADGSLDTSFNPGTGANGTVLSMVLQPDGKILIGGNFTSYNGTTRNYIARINADGSLDTSFNPGTGANFTVWSMVLQPDGKILIGGNFTSYNGTTRNYIARINADGSLDTSFNPGTGANFTVWSMVLQPDGKILIGGDFTGYNGTTRNYIARINADGSLDTSFNPGTGANSTVRSIVLQPDGKIIIGGQFTSYNGASISRIARINADGSLDGSFNPGLGANGFVRSMVLQPDGKILIGGDFSSYNGTSRSRIARINADGSLDGSFNPGTGANNMLLIMVLQPDGKILIGGFFTSYNGIVSNRIARLNSEGSLDNSFNSGIGANGTVWAMALQLDGKILIGGDFTTYNGININRIARLNDEGSLDTSFNPAQGPNGQIQSILTQTDGKVLIGGFFNGYNFTNRNNFGRLNLDGGIDTSFNPGTGPNFNVLSIVFQSDGKILIGGSFTAYNQVSRVRIARIYGGGEALDEEAPSADLETLEPINAQCQVNFDDLSIPTSTDLVDGIIQGITDQTIFPITAQGITTITWTYTDDAGNESSQTQEIIIDDTTAPIPTLETLADVTGECAATVTTVPTALDNCQGTITGTTEDPLTYHTQGTHTVTWKFDDGNGNTSQQTQTVIVKDVTAPVPSLTQLPEISGECSVTVSEAPTALDNCQGTITGTTEDPLTYHTQGTHTVTWKFDDGNGNTSQQTQTVIVKDVTAPVPTSETLADVIGECAATVTTVPTALDNCQGTILGTTEDPLTYNTQGTHTITWKFDDGNGNTSQQTQRVIVKDITAPVPTFETLADVTGECAATVTTVPTALDNCQGTILGTTEDPLTYNTQGTHTVTWKFDDGNGNTSQQIQTVIVKDVTGPVPILETLADVTGECAATVTTVPTALDNCQGTILGTTEDPLTYNTQGTHTVTWKFDDGNGNTSQQTQTVIVKDETAPVPTSQTLSDVTGECAATVTTVPTALDNCQGTIQGTTEDPLTYSTQGTHTITWKFDDGNGNASQQTQTVIVKDVTPPVPTSQTLADVTVECAATVTTAPTALDNCQGTIQGTTEDPLTYNTQGTHTVTWKFDDGNGNTSQQTQTVIVKDITAPVPTLETLADVTGECAATVTTVPTALDNCQGTILGTTEDPLTYNTQGTHIISWTFDDGNGNTSQQTQTVIVKDVTAPVPTLETLADVTGECAATVTTVPTALDNCQGTILGTTEDTLTYNTQGTHTITWDFDDGIGNTSQQTQRVIVKDVTAPVPTLETLADVTGECAATVTTVPTALDNCKGTIQGTTTDLLTYNTQGTHTVTWKFDDGNGNKSQQTQRVIVKDITAPVPTSETLADVTGECAATVTTVPTALDNCQGTILGTTEDPLTYNTQGTHTVTWKFDDGNGNTSQQTQTVIVKDITAPVPSLAQLPIIMGECSATVSAPTAIDSCQGIITGTTADPISYGVQGTYTINWIFDDGNGNTATQEQTVIVEDIIAPIPTLSTLPTITTETSVVVFGSLASDNCEGAIIGTTSDPTSYSEQGTYTITWVYRDSKGNTSTQNQTVIVNAATIPVWNTLPGSLDRTLYCSQDHLLAQAQLLAPAPSDPDRVVSLVKTSGGFVMPGPNGAGTLTNTWIATDLNGIQSQVFTQVITFQGIEIDASASSIPVQVGTSATLSATVLPAVSGVKVTFLLDGNQVGFANTDVTGKATISVSGLSLDVYKVTAVVGSGCSESIAYLPVYDPNGNFVTGGGWINSPEGALVGTTTVGKANFGFVSKYKKGSNQVDGNTEFQFNAGSLSFKSILHEAGTLVISGKKATYRGEGSINGVSGFKFTLVAIDGQWNGGTNPDQFRIKIWGSNGVIYDNGLGAADNSEVATVLGGGSIVIHESKAKGNKRVSTELITVAWSTPFETIKKKLETQSSTWFEGRKLALTLDARTYDPLTPGLYELKADLVDNEFFELDEPIAIQVLVQDKPIALDIELSNQKVVKNAGSGTVIGTLNTIDPVDDIHTYSMDPNPDLEIRGNQLIWKGINTPAAQMKFTVFSTDRAGQTISKDIVLTREVGPNQFILYPNPAQNETNIMVDLDEGAEVEIQVFDAVGRMVIEDTIYRGSTFIQTLDLNGLAPGMYMVQVKIGYIIMTERLIKR